jgi:TRAP-type mannitol/chloroaromatic compound transport system permease large subunit
MYRGVIPFVIIQIIALGIVSYYPETVLWLPDKLLGFEGQ